MADEDYPESGGIVSIEPQTTTPAAQAEAARVLGRYESGEYRGGEDALMGEYARVNAQAVAALRAARERLANANYPAELGSLGFSAGLMAPTRSGTIGESFGKAYENVREDKQRELEYNLRRNEQLGQYDLAIPQQDLKTLEARMQLQRLHEQMEGPLAREALRTLGRTTAAGMKPGQLKEQSLPDGRKQFVRIMPDDTVVPVGQPYGESDAPDPRLAQMIRNYEIYPSGFSLTRPKMQNTLALAETLPGPDEHYGGQPKFLAIEGARKSWEGGGQNDQTIQRMNTAVDHLERMYGWAQKLNSGDMRPLNMVRQWWQANMQGNPMPPAFDAVKVMVAREIMSAIAARGGSVEETAEIKAAVDKARNYDSLREIMDRQSGLLAGRLTANRHNFMQDIPGATADEYNKKLLPTTRQRLMRLEQEGKAGSDTAIAPTQGWGKMTVVQ